MKLSKLCVQAGMECPEGGDTNVTGFAIDNRKVAPGTVFGAFQGTQVNGEDFIPAAIEAGAVAVVARAEAKVEGAIHIARRLPTSPRSSLRPCPTISSPSPVPTGRPPASR